LRIVVRHASFTFHIHFALTRSRNGALYCLWIDQQVGCHVANGGSIFKSSLKEGLASLYRCFYCYQPSTSRKTAPLTSAIAELKRGIAIASNTKITMTPPRSINSVTSRLQDLSRAKMAEYGQLHGPSHRSLPQESAAESSDRTQQSGNQTQGLVLHNCRIDNFYNITGGGGPRPPVQAPAPPIPDDISDSEPYRVPRPEWPGHYHPSMRPPPSSPTIPDYVDRRRRPYLPPPPLWLSNTLRRLRSGRYRNQDPHFGYPIMPVARSPSPHERWPARSQIPRPTFATGRFRRAVYSETGSMNVSTSESDSDFSSSSSGGVRNDTSLDIEAEYRKSCDELMRRMSIDSYEAMKERGRASKNETRSRRFGDRWHSGPLTEIEGTAGAQVCRFRCGDGCVTGRMMAEDRQGPARGAKSESSRTAAAEDGIGRAKLHGIIAVGERPGGVSLQEEDDESIVTYSNNFGLDMTTLTPAEGSQRSVRRQE
jgi:hypothetical protein